MLKEKKDLLAQTFFLFYFNDIIIVSFQKLFA